MDKLSRLGIMALAAVLLFLVPAVATAQPPVAQWYGSVKMKGANVPNGTLVTAWVNSVQVGRTTTTTYDGYSFYVISATGDLATLAGKPVLFLVGDVSSGQQAAESGIWTPGLSTSLNLTYTPPTPTPTPMPLVKVETVMASVAGKYAMVWGWDPASQTWQVFDPAAPIVSNSLTNMEEGKGYWIQATEETTLTYGGKTRRLYKGWNLIGW